MASTATETITERTLTITPSKRKLVCFSFAAYAKTLIAHLKSCNIPVAAGLTDAEFAEIESNFAFIFPPDLRSVLQAGLPISPGFPNWRSSSSQQLTILLNLPTQGLLKEVSERRFWCDSWGAEPAGRDEAVEIVREALSRAPVLIPIYRDLYIPASPAAAGNPVFYIHGGDVRVSSFDLSGFFQEVEFLQYGNFRPTGVLKKLSKISPPVWAATAARRIEAWTDVAERGRKVVARGESRGWWRGDMGVCLEEVFWKLRDGGWNEEEVREMMAMDGPDEIKISGPNCGPNDGPNVVTDKEGVSRQMRILAVVLSRAGWTREDVVYSLGFQGDQSQSGDTMFDFPEKKQQHRTMHLQSLEV